MPLESQGVQAWDRYAFVNNNPTRYIDPTGHGACDGPNADPECANVKKSSKIELPGWNSSYIQGQPDLQGCFPAATAGAISTFMGGQVSAKDLDIAMERDIWKLAGGGVPPLFQDNAINSLADRGMGNFSAVYTRGTRSDLINNLNSGSPTIVSVSWGYTREMGHALLVTSYDQTTNEFSFFDPAESGSVITEKQFVTIYGIAFDQAWLQQPTIFIPAGSMVTIIPEP